MTTELLANGWRLHQAGDFPQAEQVYRQFLQQEPGHAQGWFQLGSLYQAQGKYAQAEPRYRRALAIIEKALGPEHPDVATVLDSLAGLYEAQGKYLQAEPRYRRALAILEKALGPEHPDVAPVLENFAGFLRKTNRAAVARDMEARARIIKAKRAEIAPAK